MEVQLVIINLNKDNGKGNKEGEVWRVKELSRDHKPELTDEKERILATNGRVERYTSKKL